MVQGAVHKEFCRYNIASGVQAAYGARDTERLLRRFGCCERVRRLIGYMAQRREHAQRWVGALQVSSQLCCADRLAIGKSC